MVRASAKHRIGEAWVYSASGTTWIVTSTTTSVGGDLDRELAHRLDRAMGQAHLGLDDGRTGLGQGFGDVGIGDRAEQTAVNAGLLADGHGLAGDLLAQGLSGDQLLGMLLFEFGALGFPNSLIAASVARRAWRVRIRSCEA